MLFRSLSEYWQLRRDRQKEIDASIAKRADVELLYDQPYEDNKRIRVAGPFTVSISTRKCSTDLHPHCASNLRQECTTFAMGVNADRLFC